MFTQVLRKTLKTSRNTAETHWSTRFSCRFCRQRCAGLTVPGWRWGFCGVIPPPGPAAPRAAEQPGPTGPHQETPGSCSQPSAANFRHCTKTLKNKNYRSSSRQTDSSVSQRGRGNPAGRPPLGHFTEGTRWKLFLTYFRSDKQSAAAERCPGTETSRPRGEAGPPPPAPVPAGAGPEQRRGGRGVPAQTSSPPAMPSAGAGLPFGRIPAEGAGRRSGGGTRRAPAAPGPSPRAPLAAVPHRPGTERSGRRRPPLSRRLLARASRSQRSPGRGSSGVA